MSRPCSHCFILCLAFSIVAGCAPDAPPTLEHDVPFIGRQIQDRVPSLKESHFSTLLDFESASDDVFVTPHGGPGIITPLHAHTGQAGYQTDPHVDRLTVKLGSLMSGRSFPGDWTLAGGYVYAQQAGRVNVSFNPLPAGSHPQSVDLQANVWTPVFVEIPQGLAATGGIPSLVFELSAAPGPLWFDDVMLVDNFKVLSGDEGHAPWQMVRRGFSYIGTANGQFTFTLVTSEASAAGWAVDEANAMRARFHSAAGTVKQLTVYSDGRAYWDGQYRTMSAACAEPLYTDSHLSPGTIDIAEDMGRVDRNTAGDANNDGYNEITGTYRIIANGPRVELRLVPHGSPLIRPVLELSGLPLGKPLVTLEGRLAESVCRTSSGTVLVELPARIDRAVTVDVRIE